MAGKFKFLRSVGQGLASLNYSAYDGKKVLKPLSQSKLARNYISMMKSNPLITSAAAGAAIEGTAGAVHGMFSKDQTVLGGFTRGASRGALKGAAAYGGYRAYSHLGRKYASVGKLQNAASRSVKAGYRYGRMNIKNAARSANNFTR